MRRCWPAGRWALRRARVISALMYFGLLAIPAGRLFAVTSSLITLLAAGMAAQAVLFLQNGGFLSQWMTPVWDTSWLLEDDGLTGRLLHTLIGYTAQPDGAQLFAYAATVIGIGLLMRVVGGRRRPRRASVSVAPAE